VDGGEAVIVVLHAGHLAVVREALGRHAGDVTFIDRDAFTRGPEAALGAYDAMTRRLLAGGVDRVRGELPAVTRTASGTGGWPTTRSSTAR
jgi:hypothetical protein